MPKCRNEKKKYFHASCVHSDIYIALKLAEKVNFNIAKKKTDF